MDRTDDDVAKRDLLSTPRRIAVVGASPKPERASHRIFVFLKEQGHDVLPVNPVVDEVAGVPAVADLADAKEHWGHAPDIVDVFRRPEHLEAVVDEAIAVGASWVWGQLGVTDDAAWEKAEEAGLEYVADRCILVEAKRLV